MEQNSNQVPKKQIPEHEKINTLIMLGNGYDLTYGYKTSYRDFIKSNYFEEKKTDNGLFWRISEKEEHEDWTDLETLLYMYAEEQRRSLQEITLPDNGLAPLPKRGEVAQKITDFKNEYGLLCKQLCKFIMDAIIKNPTNPKFIKIDDYSHQQISKIIGQFPSGKLLDENSEAVVSKILTTINESLLKIKDSNTKIEGYLQNPNQDSFQNIKNAYENLQNIYEQIKKQIKDVLGPENDNYSGIVSGYITSLVEDIEKQIKNTIKTIDNAVKTISKQQNTSKHEEIINSFNNKIRDQYNTIRKDYEEKILKACGRTEEENDKTKKKETVYKINEEYKSIRKNFTNKENDSPVSETLKDLDTVQQEILRVLIAYDIKNHYYNFEKLQEGWGERCSLDSHILTFNYTDPKDCISRYFLGEKQIIRVHGRLKKRYKEGQIGPRIVLGIDESMKVHRAFNFLHKSYQEGLNILDLSHILRHTKRFIIYGCSIGSTDKWYFNQIFKDIEGHITKKRVFEIYYYNNDAKESLQDCITDIVGDLMEFQSKNFVRWIRVEGTGIKTACDRREELDKEELEYLELL